MYSIIYSMLHIAWCMLLHVVAGRACCSMLFRPLAGCACCRRPRALSLAACCCMLLQAARAVACCMLLHVVTDRACCRMLFRLGAGCACCHRPRALLLAACCRVLLQAARAVACCVLRMLPQAAHTGVSGSVCGGLYMRVVACRWKRRRKEEGGVRRDGQDRVDVVGRSRSLGVRSKTRWIRARGRGRKE